MNLHPHEIEALRWAVERARLLSMPGPDPQGIELMQRIKEAERALAKLTSPQP